VLGKVRPTIILIGYPDEVAKVIAFVFSNMLICDDTASVQVVTFACEVGVRSVTFDKDMYELSGMMSGGTGPSGSGMLVRVQELRVGEYVTEAWRRLGAREREEVAGRDAWDAWRARMCEVEIKEHELQLLEGQVGSSNAAWVRVCFCSCLYFHSLNLFPGFPCSDV
jgi:structural maintenance of chromosome 2